MTSHPVYGDITYNTWLPAYGHRTIKLSGKEEFMKLDNYEIIFLDSIEIPFQLRNKKTKNIKKYINEYYTNLNYNNKRINISITHTALASAFPNIPTLQTVDHINDNPKDNRVINLQWMSQSENSKKGNKKSVRRIIKMEVATVDMCLYIVQI